MYCAQCTHFRVIYGHLPFYLECFAFVLGGGFFFRVGGVCLFDGFFLWVFTSFVGIRDRDSKLLSVSY